MRIIYSFVQGPTIKINKNKPGEHIKCNVKWFNVDLVLLRPLSTPHSTLFMSLFAFNHPATKSARHNNFVTTTTTTTEGKQTDPTKKMAESRPRERVREREGEGNPGTLCGASVENYGPELAQHMKCNSLFFALITRE